MRHLKKGRKLNRTSAHRKALLSNLAMNLLEKGRITTTTAKAKELRGVVDRLITFAKKGGLHGRRMIARSISKPSVQRKLMESIGPEFKDRNGGYSRVLKLGQRRGDAAELSLIELVGYVPKAKPKKENTSEKEEKRKEAGELNKA